MATIETITWIDSNTGTVTIEPLINWITKPVPKLSEIKARARLYKAGIKV